MPETAIFDHYEVLTRDDGSLFELGRGAMGITYKAFDRSLKFPVALKVINSAYLNSEVARQRFIREARSAAKLRHRNVASVFHLGTEGDTWFYAMEYIDGETLDGLIKRQGPLAPVVALTITAQVARALNAATQHGLVHRDIKPANLMLVKEDDDLVAKVIDFGLAKTAVPDEGEDPATLSMGGFVGTPHFASPEQLEEREIDVRSDIYSLGVTLWYMLAGKAPFAGSMAQVMSQHLTKPPPFEKLKDVPPTVADILRKMLAKDPAERFQAPAELRKAIGCLLDHDPSDSVVITGITTGPGENLATLLDDSTPHSGMGSFETNTIIAGRYRIVAALGETNAGHLYHACDTEQKREVRLVVLPPAVLGDTAALAALEREVEKLAKVRHPNLLGVTNFETVDRGSFLVLEWTSGFSLLELLKARRELDAEEALKLLAQAAAGVDYALELGLSGLEFGLHQVQCHFPQAIEKGKLLRASLRTWPAFELKLNPLGVHRDIATSQTWAGGQTMVAGDASHSADGGDARPRYLQALAAVIYEILGGTLSPLVLHGAGGSAMRYTPLTTLSEEGNEVLKRALDPARSFASAREFHDALARLDRLQVPRREIKLPPAPAQPSATRTTSLPAKTAASQVTPSLPPLPRKAPLGLIAGAAAVVVAAVAAAYFLQHPPAPAPEVAPNGQLISDTPPPSPPAPAATTIHKPARQDLLQAAVKSAQEFEENKVWDKALSGWLSIAKEYPEDSTGKNHLATLLAQLRESSPPISPQEFREMRPMITEAAQLDVLAAMVLLGDNLCKAEPETAAKWFAAASEKGDGYASTQLGFLHETGSGVGQDFVKAAQYFQMAADRGDIVGKFAMGRCYLFGRGLLAKDEARGVALVREAADAGEPRAIFLLGDCYLKGTGVKANYAEALRLFSRAAERGSLQALDGLGVLYMTGRGLPAPDARKAAEFFERAARAGVPSAMFHYAQCLEQGDGVNKNVPQAQEWYRKAAEAGDKRAMELRR